MGMTKEEAWAAAEQGVVVDMKDLTGLNVDVERVDVDVLLTSQPDTFNLMLLAIEAMQQDSSLLGWFQIAGIHGYPTIRWDSPDQSNRTWDNNDKKFGSWGGYCAHGTLTFGPRHRPYLALLEQTIYRNMVTIAHKYTDAEAKARYLAAAQKFRLPYVDYFRARAAGHNVTRRNIKKNDIRDPRRDHHDEPAEPAKFEYDFGLPDIFLKPEVTIKRFPDNEPKPGPNPLYSYRFTAETGELQRRDRDALVSTPAHLSNARSEPRTDPTQAKYGSTKMTIRCPSLVGDNRKGATAHGDHQLNYNLNWSVQDRVSLLLSFMRDHPLPDLSGRRFGRARLWRLHRGRTGAWWPPQRFPRGPSQHLPQPHRPCRPHGRPQVRRLRPRLLVSPCQHRPLLCPLASRQPPRCRPPRAMVPLPAGPGQTYDGEKPLYPFYKRRDGPGAGEYWTSDSVQQTGVLGYVYDDFSRMAKLNQTAPEYMGKRCDWATRKPDSSILADMTIPLLSSAVEASPFFHPPPPKAVPGMSSMMRMPPVPPPGAPIVPLNAIDPRFDRDWYVDSRVKRMAANGSFTIYFFLSPKGVLPDAKPAEYVSSPYLVGMHHVFTSRREGCDNCASAKEEGKLSVGTAPITGALLRYLEDQVESGEGVESMRPEHVAPFLKERLRWRVVFHGFDRKDPRAEGLQLKIGVSAKVYHDDGEPTYEEYPDVVDMILAAASPVASAVAGA